MARLELTFSRYRRRKKLTYFGQPRDDYEGREGEEEADLRPPPIGHMDATMFLIRRRRERRWGRGPLADGAPGAPGARWAPPRGPERRNARRWRLRGARRCTGTRGRQQRRASLRRRPVIVGPVGHGRLRGREVADGRGAAGRPRRDRERHH